MFCFAVFAALINCPRFESSEVLLRIRLNLKPHAVEKKRAAHFPDRTKPHLFIFGATYLLLWSSTGYNIHSKDKRSQTHQCPAVILEYPAQRALNGQSSPSVHPAGGWNIRGKTLLLLLCVFTSTWRIAPRATACRSDTTNIP